MITLIDRELLQREYTIKALQEEGNKFIEIILQNEKDLTEREITYEKITFLEEQLYKLKNLIEKDGNDKKIQNCDVLLPNKEITPLLNDRVPQKLRVGVIIPEKNDDLISKVTNSKSVVILSDTYGRSMANSIAKKLPVNYSLFNSCKPFDRYGNIINDDIVRNVDNEDVIILIGDYYKRRCTRVLEENR